MNQLYCVKRCLLTCTVNGRPDESSSFEELLVVLLVNIVMVLIEILFLY
jgi:hypothetical protein